MLREEDKPWILTIHGMASPGKWQNTTEFLLKPYYRYRAFHYQEYRHLVPAVFWLALQPLTALLGILTGWAILWDQPFSDWWNLVPLVLLLPLCWFVSGIVAACRLNRVAGHFLKFWGETVGVGRPPHVIAHSLGTFITGACLAKESVSAQKIILTGCVLHRYFDWESLLDAGLIGEVRNEMASKDWVTRAAFLLHGFFPRMGHAGVFGFDAPPHTFLWNDPHRVRWYCESGCTCATAPSSGDGRLAFVHNIKHRDLGHSDYFLGPAHALAFWLPALWGIPPLPFSKFLCLCQNCRQAEVNYSDNGSELENKLRTSCWGWTKGPLENRVRNQVASAIYSVRGEKIEDLVSLSIHNLWCIVTEAVERQKEEKYAVNLNPEFALSNAIEAALGTAADSKRAVKP